VFGVRQARGQHDYPEATRLLITADAGGSNSYRYRLWKAELAAFAAGASLNITVCHFPPGTSKWNKIEHRLFSHITMNWRGRPLTSHEVVLNTIAATATRTGLRVEAALDHSSYPTGIAVSRDPLQALPITAHATHGQWNYSIAPTGGTAPAPCPNAGRPSWRTWESRTPSKGVRTKRRNTSPRHWTSTAPWAETSIRRSYSTTSAP
jgi:DDE family transposase